jgi:hypothetical protein
MEHEEIGVLRIEASGEIMRFLVGVAKEQGFEITEPMPLHGAVEIPHSLISGELVADIQQIDLLVKTLADGVALLAALRSFLKQTKEPSLARVRTGDGETVGIVDGQDDTMLLESSLQVKRRRKR